VLLSITVDQVDRFCERADAFTNEVEERAISWLHPLTARWLVDTDESAGAWTDRARTHFGGGSQVLVFEIAGRYWGYGDQLVWIWLSARLPTRASLVTN
jgi:hypothetical protein